MNHTKGPWTAVVQNVSDVWMVIDCEANILFSNLTKSQADTVVENHKKEWNI